MSSKSESVQLDLSINGATAFKTLKELNTHVRDSTKALEQMDRANPNYEQVAKNLRSAKEQQKAWRNEINGTTDNQKDFNKELSKTTTTQGGFMNTLKAGAAGIAAYFSVDAIIGFGKQVLNITAEFGKFRAVLGNTFGSKNLANLAMQEITDFAARTPYSVNELTESFVKLANQGFVPTRDEMRKLGDLAASTGKPFNQLSEAILDAMSGENERLKEFGIKAKVNGDQVSYTFKGVTTTIDNTTESIREYITSLGDVQGVSGSMAVISEELTGKISNFGDTWDQMLLSVGSNTEGVFAGSIDIMGRAVEKITEFNNELNIASKYNLGSDWWQKINRGFTGATDRELAVAGIQNAQDRVNAFVTKTMEGAKSAKDFSTAIQELNKDAKEWTFAPGIKMSKGEARGIKDQYITGMQTLRDAALNLVNKEGGTSGPSSAEAKAAEALKKKQEASRKKAATDHQSLLKDITQAEIQAHDLRLTAAEKELEVNDRKFADLSTRAKGNKEELSRIDNAWAESTLVLMNKQADEEIKKQKEITEKTKEELIKRVNAKADIEQKIYELGFTDSQKDQAGIDSMFEGLIGDAESAGINTEALFASWGAAKQKAYDADKNAHKLTEEEKAEMAIKMAEQTADTVFTIMNRNRQAESQANIDNINKRRADELENKELSEAQKQAINEKYDKQVAAERTKAWKAEQRAAIVQAIINGALAMTKVSAQTGVLTFAFSPLVALATAAQLAIIASQKAPQFSRGGQLPNGPSHENGGLSLIDPSGRKVGEVEGGEPILSRETYANNRQLIDTLLYSSQRMNGARIGINTSKAIEAERMFRSGGISPVNQNNTVNQAPVVNVDLSVLVDRIEVLTAAVQEEKTRPAKMVYTDFEKVMDRMDGIRDSVNC